MPNLTGLACPGSGPYDEGDLARRLESPHDVVQAYPAQKERRLSRIEAMCPRQHTLVDLSRGPGAQQLRDLLDAYMAEHGLRATEQRRLIIDTFMACEPHVSIDELLAQVRKKDGRIGYATVYRTLKMLADSGIAHERHFDDGFARYELADVQSHHDHLICTRCGKIVEFEEPEIESLQVAVAERHGFEVTHHRHELYGICAECRRNKTEEPREAQKP